MDALARLFCSPARLKLLRLFVFNDTKSFTLQEASFRTKSTTTATRKELTVLVSIGILRRRGTGRSVRFSVNHKFVHLDSLTRFLRETTVVGPQDVLTVLHKAGTLRLVVLTGIFSGALEPKIDLLVVGDKMEERLIASAVHTIEANFGREIRYATFTTEDFRYRSGVYDRLLRDIFDYSHRTILDKIGI